MGRAGGAGAWDPGLAEGRAAADHPPLPRPAHPQLQYHELDAIQIIYAKARYIILCISIIPPPPLTFFYQGT